jgi:hypothetical protein
MATWPRCRNCWPCANGTAPGWWSTTPTASACWGHGRGALEHFGLRSPNLVYIGTLGKAAGVGGAFIAAHASVIELMIQRARPYIYTTAAPPALAHALLASLDIIEGEEGANAARTCKHCIAHSTTHCAWSAGSACVAHRDPADRHRRNDEACAWRAACTSKACGCRRSVRRRLRRARRACA